KTSTSTKQDAWWGCSDVWWRTNRGLGTKTARSFASVGLSFGPQGIFMQPLQVEGESIADAPLDYPAGLARGDDGMDAWAIRRPTGRITLDDHAHVGSHDCLSTFTHRLASYRSGNPVFPRSSASVSRGGSSQG